MKRYEPIAVGAAVVLALSVNPSSWAALDDGVAALKISVSAEASALGGFVPMQEGVDAVFSNVAGLAAVGKNAVTLTHAALFANTSVNALGGGFNLGRDRGTLGFSAITLTQGAMTARDQNGEEAGSLTAYDAVVGLSWAKPIERHNIGLGVKHVRQSLAEVTATGVAGDIGYQYRFSRAVAGVSIQNIGPAMRFIDETSPLPLTASIGAKYDVKGLLLLNTSLAHRPHARRTTTGFGAELSLGQATTLRAGYLTPIQSADAVSAVKILSNFGFGLGWKLPSKRLKIDYSMMPGSSDLGMTHRFTLQVGWGATHSNRYGRGLRDEGLDESDYYTPFFQSL